MTMRAHATFGSRQGFVVCFEVEKGAFEANECGERRTGLEGLG